MPIPVAAEVITSIGHFPVTNAWLDSTGVVLLVIVFAVILNLGLKKIPGRLQSFAESALEFVLGYFDRVTGSREKSRRFLPLVGTLFFFIVICNWLGLLPGIGSIGVTRAGDFIPLLRSANSDLNLTLAMALVAVVSSHVLGMKTLGVGHHIGKFFQFAALGKALITLNPIKILVAFVEFAVGLLELVSEVAKVISLSLRLFGNVFAGEILLGVISSLISVAVPLPFMFLELIVGVVQATVFAMLTLVYLTVMTTEHTGTSHDTHDEDISDYGAELAPALS